MLKKVKRKEERSTSFAPGSVHCLEYDALQETVNGQKHSYDVYVRAGTPVLITEYRVGEKTVVKTVDAHGVKREFGLSWMSDVNFVCMPTKREVFAAVFKVFVKEITGCAAAVSVLLILALWFGESKWEIFYRYPMLGTSLVFLLCAVCVVGMMGVSDLLAPVWEDRTGEDFLFASPSLRKELRTLLNQKKMAKENNADISADSDAETLHQ